MNVIWSLVRSKGMRGCTSLRCCSSFTGIVALLALLTCPDAGTAKTQSFSIMDSYNGAKVTVQCSDASIELTGIHAMSYNKTKKKNEPSNHDYVHAAAPLLQFQVNGHPTRSRV